MSDLNDDGVLGEACQHDVKPIGNGFGRCSKCKETDFPLSAEAAGALPCCGDFGDHLEHCDGVVRQPWALARAAQKELEQAIATLDYPPFNRVWLRERLAVVLEQLDRIALDGADPPPRRGPPGRGGM